MTTKPTDAQLQYIVDNIYCSLDDVELGNVVEAVIALWEKLKANKLAKCSCGSYNIHTHKQTDAHGGVEVAIVCKTCCNAVIGKTEKEAIAAWNKRVTMRRD